jgi:hypothetical protein
MLKIVQYNKFFTIFGHLHSIINTAYKTEYAKNSKVSFEKISLFFMNCTAVVI